MLLRCSSAWRYRVSSTSNWIKSSWRRNKIADGLLVDFVLARVATPRCPPAKNEVHGPLHRRYQGPRNTLQSEHGPLVEMTVTFTLKFQPKGLERLGGHNDGGK